MKKSIGKKKKKKRAVAFFKFIAFVMLFTIGFFLGGHISQKNTLAVSSTKVLKDDKEQDFTKVEDKKDTNVNKENSSKHMENKVKKNHSKFFNPYIKKGHKVIYLTFDDGPSYNNTPLILDILKKHDIKATFFVIGELAKEYPDLIKREHKEGHAIGNHTYSHDYDYIYSNPSNFMDDVKKCEDTIKAVLGKNYVESRLVRFPGGSFGKRLNPYKELVKKEGYNFVDWNALNGDAEAALVPIEQLLLRIKNTVPTGQNAVVLMHDAPAKTTTVEALEAIIQYLKGEGYEFKTL